MIAARPFQDLSRGIGRSAFDLPVAALAGLAAAVLAFAMPADLLGNLVSATGLPHLLAAAESPLGFKARFMIGVAGAGAAFGLAYLLMRMLDRGAGSKARTEPEWDEEERPRLRRRDLHPDAPVCRPISAARDFGEPAPPTLEPAADPVPASFAEPAPPLEAEDHSAPAWSAEPEEEPLELTERPAPAWLADAEPEAGPPEPEPAAEASLPDLMRRLEQGLARRRTRHDFAMAPQPHVHEPQVFPDPGDDRLQSAIESLQRFAARGD